MRDFLVRTSDAPGDSWRTWRSVPAVDQSCYIGGGPMITPQAMRAPAFPLGCDFRSSASA